MLCYQCGLAKNGKYCNDTLGACGKSAESSRLQDELTGALIGLAKASVHKSVSEEVQRLMVEGLAATAAHSCFDDDHIVALTEAVKAAKTTFIPKFGGLNASLKLPEDFDIRLIWQKTPTIRSLKSLLLFGIRGIAHFARESWALGSKNKEAAGFFQKALIALGANHFKEDYDALLKEMGGIALRAMEMAEKARFRAFGDPDIVEVPRIIDPGPFIVVSGHRYDLLESILEQTGESGVAVYSHGEMLPAHAYPLFRKYPLFKGHYGTGWQNQQNEFDHIPGAVIFTGGCIMPPLPSYTDRLFTAGGLSMAGIPHLDQDITPALIRSIELEGAPGQIPFPGINGGTAVRTGFGKKSVRTVSYKLAAALAEGNLHRIEIIGGCDGTEESRKKYTDRIRRIPEDAVVLTLGCGKFRFNDIDYGTIDGIPRIIDIGTCGDLPLLIETISAIAESAKLRIEDLPLHWHFTWQEERSVAALFALFAADIHNVVLGPALPPFFTEEVFQTYAGEYGITRFDSIETTTPAATETEEEEGLPISAPEEEPKLLPEDPPPEESGETEEKQEVPMEIEARSAAAGLPDWAVMDEEDEAKAAKARAAAEAETKTQPTAAKARPEDPDQTPDFAREGPEIPPEPPMDIEARSAAAGLPDWAVMDEADEYEENEETEEIKEYNESEALPDMPPEEPLKEEPFRTEPPKIVLPKGKGVSGWKDPDEEPTFVPGAAKKPYRYTPPKELVEIPAPPPISLPPGAGVSGFAANHDHESPKNESSETLYSFAEPLPEIKIPKGKGVSGWKESDDEIRPGKQEKKKDAAEKPWLKKSLEKLHAEVEADQKAPTPIPAAIPPQKEEIAEKPSEKPEPMPETHPDKPWLDQSLKDLKASIAADEEEAATKNTEKPWLKASLAQLHAEVEADREKQELPPTTEDNTEPTKKAEESEEPYVSAFQHDATAAAEKPWLKTSIQELKESIDRDAGIKTIRKDEKKDPAKEKTPAEAAKQWQNAPTAPAWKDIAPRAENTQTQKSPEKEEATGGGEPDAQWQKPKVLPKPWDKDLQTQWSKPEVLPKPWEMQQPSMYHKPGPEGLPAQGNTISNPPLETPPQQPQEPAAALPPRESSAQWEAQQAAAMAMAQQQALAQQQQAAQAAEQRALYEQRRLEEQNRQLEETLAQQEAYARRLQQQAYQIQAARAQQEARAAQLNQEALRLRQLQQQQQQYSRRQSMRDRQEQAAYAAQLEQQAQQLRIAQQQQMAYRQQLEQQAAEMQSAQAAYTAQKEALYQQQQALAAAMAQQQQARGSDGASWFPSPREEQVVIPADAGVSGFRQDRFIPGQERSGGNINDAIRTYQSIPQGTEPNLPANGGISGSRYHEELPPIICDYSQTCYGVPQTPKVNLPHGAGTSGWVDPNPPAAPTAPANNFFGFMDSDAPAGVRSNQEIITPGSGDEFIATKGPNGEVTVTIRADKK